MRVKDVGDMRWRVGEEESESAGADEAVAEVIMTRREESGATATARTIPGVSVPTVSKDCNSSTSASVSCSRGRIAMSPERVMMHSVCVSAMTVNDAICDFAPLTAGDVRSAKRFCTWNVRIDFAGKRCLPVCPAHRLSKLEYSHRQR